jgi:predicted ATP-grasp superfamily ATP-dependent carboligase
MYSAPDNSRVTNYQSLVESDKITAHNAERVALNEIYHALVLDAGLRQSLATIRSLGSRGLCIAALAAFNGESVPAFSSRWCRQGIVCGAGEATEEYLTFVEQLLDRIDARVLIASSDSTLALVRLHRERLERRVRIALAEESALAIAVNKEQTLEIARRLGLAIPRAVTVGEVNEVSAALREIGLPAVVKPVESWVWGEQQGARYASKLVTTSDEARLAVEELTHLGGKTLFQQFLTGRREAISFLYAQGEIYARFAQWAKRTEPPLGGQSVLRQSIAVPPDLGEQAERLVRAIELEGYSEVEFRRDGAGVPYLMEINPRLSASVEIAVRAGVDFPYLLYQWASGEHIDRVEHYRTGNWMRYLEGDILTTLQALIQHGRPGVTPPAHALFDFFLSFFEPMGYDYFDWKDPLPAWTATIEFGRYIIRRTKRSLAKRRVS